MCDCLLMPSYLFGEKKKKREKIKKEVVKEEQINRIMN